MIKLKSKYVNHTKLFFTGDHCFRVLLVLCLLLGLLPLGKAYVTLQITGSSSVARTLRWAETSTEFLVSFTASFLLFPERILARRLFDRDRYLVGYFTGGVTGSLSAILIFGWEERATLFFVRPRGDWEVTFFVGFYFTIWYLDGLFSFLTLFFFKRSSWTGEAKRLSTFLSGLHVGLDGTFLVFCEGNALGKDTSPPCILKLWFVWVGWRSSKSEDMSRSNILKF